MKEIGGERRVIWHGGGVALAGLAEDGGFFSGAAVEAGGREREREEKTSGLSRGEGGLWWL